MTRGAPCSISPRSTERCRSGTTRRASGTLSSPCVADDRVYVGKERHDIGRPNDVGYPVRAVRTTQFLYARNFKADRWPAGNPETGYTNIDDSPTKRHVLELKDAGQPKYYELAMGMRPLEELYDLRFIREVRGERVAAAFLRQLLQSFGIAGHKGDGIAFPGKPQRDRAAQTVPRAGHEQDFTHPAMAGMRICTALLGKLCAQATPQDNAVSSRTSFDKTRMGNWIPSRAS